MAEVRLTMAFVAFLVIAGCASQLQQPQARPAPAEEKEKPPKEAPPTFTYRPRAGLTITGPM